MIINRITNAIISVVSAVTVPIQLITTFLSGLLFNVPVLGFLLLLLVSVIWMGLFLYPLIGLSYVYERFSLLRIPIAIVGIPLAVIAGEFVALIGHNGEWESRSSKLLYCWSFPYSWRFHRFMNNYPIDEDNTLKEFLIREELLGEGGRIADFIDKSMVQNYNFNLRDKYLRDKSGKV